MSPHSFLDSASRPYLYWLLEDRQRQRWGLVSFQAWPREPGVVESGANAEAEWAPEPHAETEYGSRPGRLDTVKSPWRGGSGQQSPRQLR